MSGTDGTNGVNGAAGTDGGEPRPEPIRFFGTTWVHHDGGYALRRAGVAAGSLLAAAAGAFVLRFGYEGLAVAQVGSVVNMLVVIAFAVCSAIGFRRTWDGFVRRPDPGKHDAAAERSMHSIMMIGFIGRLLAYFCRSLVEAPGEGLHREEYEEARTRHERRRASRTGNPAARGGKRRRKHG
ncbi:hypothetical protein AB0K09_33100 [Streptomyces sp. NPDC049577]|uniref:hypothetical protein n=1 Tax=Streptomyces sp. NPDC049577 TaxID=3155153 RepID=UPI00341822FE